ncbi:hypothetical protein GGX14DRAFT_566864 [Mycena pura]|uniref:Glycosyl hydrolase family 95 catalytic domain-containing protein n=1 Tax=Mycena pura TaxID=153505 RepID=A0AAD6VC29_9AGAR|nr:hypothetical protein GGX14DRAFT_566864 [Mycena pura]
MIAGHGFADDDEELKAMAYGSRPGLLDAAVLGIPASDPAVAAARAVFPIIKPHLQQIGSLGQILEWHAEYAEPVPGPKHLSPMWAHMPGHAFSPLLNSTLFDAVQVLLDRRIAHGSGGTGWSRTWLIAQSESV